MLTLESLAPFHIQEMLAFETSNRDFFELHINARAQTYYSESGVAQAIEAAMREAENDVAYQYLIRDHTERLVGRINLSRVRRAHFHSAEIGYRIAQNAGGKGYATEAVRQIIDRALVTHRLKRLEATARQENKGSVKVLMRNGFSKFGQSTRSFELLGQWYDLVHFELRLAA